jgi:cytochrome c553
MTPPPPYLPTVVPLWESEELFFIVKHGVKFTGMPAWPSQVRDDEVWAMVVFLKTLPDLDAGEYRKLVHGEGGTPPIAMPPGAVPETVVSACARCHGADGLGRGAGAFPKLAGQSETYLYDSLRAYAEEKRHSGTMEVVAAGLADEAMREVARYYAGLSQPAPAPAAGASGAIARGEAIALRGIPARLVPACADCHGPGPALGNPAYPALRGQHADYLALQLELFKKRNRGGTDYAHVMQLAAEGLSAEEMRDVARYYESLGPARVAASP